MQIGEELIPMLMGSGGVIFPEKQVAAIIPGHGDIRGSISDQAKQELTAAEFASVVDFWKQFS